MQRMAAIPGAAAQGEWERLAVLGAKLKLLATVNRFKTLKPGTKHLGSWNLY